MDGPKNGSIWVKGKEAHPEQHFCIVGYKDILKTNKRSIINFIYHSIIQISCDF